jgi:hypothetical protein
MYAGAKITVLWFKLRVVEFSKVYQSKHPKDHIEKEVW